MTSPHKSIRTFDNQSNICQTSILLLCLHVFLYLYLAGPQSPSQRLLLLQSSLQQKEVLQQAEDWLEDSQLVTRLGIGLHKQSQVRSSSSSSTAPASCTTHPRCLTV